MTPSRHAKIGLVVTALGVLATACGSHSAPAAHRAQAPRPTSATHLTISGYAYQPAEINVAPGTTITFTNRDHTPHTATSTNTGFDTGTIDPGKSAPVDITTPGTYSYYCQFHAFMHGTITVK